MFGNDVEPVFQLDRFSSKSEILSAIDRIPFLDQTTNTAAAIRYMRTIMFTAQNGDRYNVPNSAIIITDGVPLVPSDVSEARRLTLQEANLAKSQGINMFTVGIGPELTTDFLGQIADQPPSQHVFQVGQIRELESILDQVIGATCGATTQPCKFVKCFISYGLFMFYYVKLNVQNPLKMLCNFCSHSLEIET